MFVVPPRRKSARSAAMPDSLPALTGIRGLAAWWVVLYHFREHFPDDPYHIMQAVWAHGYLAVDLFFELSGFILALNYLNAFRNVSSGKALHFYGLRLARVYPLHIFMLTLFLLNPLAIMFASSAGSVGARYDPAYFGLSVVLMQNWGFTQDLTWNIPSWSISTEWLAYLFFPALAWMLGRVTGSRMRAAAVAAAMLLILALGLIAMHQTLGSDIPRNGVIRCLCEFTAGMCLFQFWRQDRPEQWKATLGLAGFAACVIAYEVYDLADFVMIPLGFLFLIYALANNSHPLSRVFSQPTIVRIGLWSYATYMVHYFVKDWVTFLLVRDSIPDQVPMVAYLAITLAASVVLYHYLEVPGRQAVRRLLTRAVPVTEGSG
jgi:peptidoglycan/LPS O-acetylase OafA/YrhL